jgi:hypothetical protein
VRDYLQAVQCDELVHRSVLYTVHDLCGFLETARRKTPDSVMVEAQRLECLLFMGYDPFFDGDEPPGL